MNPEEIQNQEPTQEIQEQTRESAIKMVIIKLPKQDYAALRSFAESSLKDTYLWNVSMCSKENYIEYGYGKKWTLYVSPRERILWARLTHVRVASNVSVKANYNITCNARCTIYRGDQKIEDVDPLNIAFTSDVPFARIIRLQEIIDKMMEYDYRRCDIIELE